MRLPTRGGWLNLTRRLAPFDAESDAALLDRFVQSRDEAAFEALVHRHGPMVHNVCRRRLGADADDAFQATFLALARDAAKIANPAALPGWLYRAAYLIALKAGGRAAARGMTSLPTEDVPMNDPPDTASDRAEQRAIVDAELATLSEKDRTAIVLCLIEGKTNSEAAALLNVPVGTIDSRLSAARKRLQAKLVRRGVAVATAAALDRLLGAPLQAAPPILRDLFAATARGVLAAMTGATAGALSPAVHSLAQGVSTMSLAKLKLLAALGLTFGLLGGTGTGIYFATADEKPAAKAPADPVKPAPPAAKPAAEKILDVSNERIAAAAKEGRTAKTTAALDKPAGFTEPIKEMPVAELLGYLSEETGTTIRLDLGFFRQFGNGNPYETKVSLPVVKGLPVRDILQDVLDQISPGGAEGGSGQKTGIRVKGNQIILGRGSVALTTPGRATVGDDVSALVSGLELANTLHGPVVGIAADNLPLADFVTQLREQTGANIVVDARLKEKLQQPVTLTVNDTRLMTVLKIAGDAYEIAPAVVDNVYYLTTKDNATALQRETYLELYGERRPAVPPGAVTDGVRLYERPANLKPLGQPDAAPPAPPAKPVEKK